MITCPYCASELTVYESGPYEEHAFCSFCQVLLGTDSDYGMYTKDGMRAERKRLPMITVEMAQEPIPVLNKYHTIDLLILLKRSREERAKQYNSLRILNKAVEHGSTEFAEPANEQGGEYATWTKHCWKIENILLERLGYYPDKIPDELVIRYEVKCQKAKKPMKISKESRKKKPVVNKV